jgi:hypothetical protein
MAGPVYAGNSGNPVFNGAATVTVNVPAGTVNGNLMIAQIWQTPQTAAAPTCAGWTQALATSNTSDSLYLFYRYASSEPASYTFTGGGTATGMSGWIHLITGAVTSGNPFNALGTGDAATGATAITDTAVTTTVANTLNMCFVTNGTGGNTIISYQSGWTGVSFTGNATLACSHIAQASAGTTGTATTTFTSNDDFNGVIGAIAPNTTTNTASIAWVS